MRMSEEHQGVELAFHACCIGKFNPLVEGYAFHRTRGFAQELHNNTPNLGGFSANNTSCCKIAAFPVYQRCNNRFALIAYNCVSFPMPAL